MFRPIWVEPFLTSSFFEANIWLFRFMFDDEEEFTKLQLKELKNGRLAMMAIMGQLIQEGLTKQGPIEQLLVGHISPFGDGQGFF